MRLSAEHREKISLKMRGRKRDPRAVVVTAEKNSGKRRSDETKRKQAEAAVKRWSDPAQRRNASLKKLGSLNPNWNEDRVILNERQDFIRRMREDMKKVKHLVLSGWHDEIVEEVGYSAGDLVRHLEKMFVLGMSWENWGEWHIDHVVPISRWALDSSSREVNSLSNLRPLWKEMNYHKNARLDDELMENI